MLVKELKTSVGFLIGFVILLGMIYPWVLSGVGHLFFPRNTSGGLVKIGQTIVGSELIGQSFSDEKYFHGRPSANQYDAQKSGGSNLAIESLEYKSLLEKRIASLQVENQTKLPVPSDLVEASGSGLDPDISLQAAFFQINRIANARHMTSVQLKKLIMDHEIIPALDIFGEPHVNVLELNLALNQGR